MAIKYYEDSLDQIEDQHLNNSVDIGMTKKDVKQWIKYIMEKENETSSQLCHISKHTAARNNTG